MKDLLLIDSSEKASNIRIAYRKQTQILNLKEQILSWKFQELDIKQQLFKLENQLEVAEREQNQLSTKIPRE